MTVYVAQISDGIVTAVTVQPADYEPQPGQVVIGPENVVGIGWTYQDGEFTPPLEEDYAPET